MVIRSGKLKSYGVPFVSKFTFRETFKNRSMFSARVAKIDRVKVRYLLKTSDIKKFSKNLVKVTDIY